MEALQEQMVGRTTIIVAHALQTIKTCDKVVFLVDGAVAEEGTHDELLARKGLFADFHAGKLREAEEKTLSASLEVLNTLFL